MPPPDRDCAGPSRLALWGYRWGVLEAYNNVTGSRPTFLSEPAHNMVTNRAGVGEVVTSRTWGRSQCDSGPLGICARGCVLLE